jgi:mannan endo-1,4-beta-mannosidase
MMARFGILLTCALFLSTISGISARHLWAGANCYFLHGLKQPDRLAVLEAAQAAGMKTIRIFITSVYANSKGAGNDQIFDVEPSWPGQYNDAILNQINDLMFEAYNHGIKLIIAMHDRYALMYPSEAYVKKYNIPTTPKQTVNDASIFYTNSEAQQDFDKRLSWILYHQNPHFNGRRWYEISEAIFSFEAQNEAMGHMDLVNIQWHCDRAKLIKNTLKNGILVTNGGGIDFPTSLQTQYFQCPYIDVICLHSYDYDANHVSQQVQKGLDLAWQYGKRIIVEEFGANNNQEKVLPPLIQSIKNLNVPWMFWEIMKPGAGGNDFEIWTDEAVWWDVISPSTKSTDTILHGWDWPEIWPGDDDGSHGSPW